MCPVSCRQRQPNKGRQKGRLRPFCRPYTWKIVPISNVVLFRYDKSHFFNDAKFFLGLECVLDNSKKVSKKIFLDFFSKKSSGQNHQKYREKKFQWKNHFFLGYGCFWTIFHRWSRSAWLKNWNLFLRIYIFLLIYVDISRLVFIFWRFFVLFELVLGDFSLILLIFCLLLFKLIDGYWFFLGFLSSFFPDLSLIFF